MDLIVLVFRVIDVNDFVLNEANVKRGLSLKLGLLFGGILLCFFWLFIFLQLICSQACTCCSWLVWWRCWRDGFSKVVQQCRVYDVNYGSVRWDFQFSKLFQAKAELAVRFGRNSDMNLSGKGRVGYSMSGAGATKTWWHQCLQLICDGMRQRFPFRFQLVDKVGRRSSMRFTRSALGTQSGEGTLAWSGAAVDSRWVL